MTPFLLGIGTVSAESPVDPDALYVASSQPQLAAATASTTAHITEVSKIRERAPSDLIGPLPVYGNFGYGEVDNANNITIETSIVYSGTVYPLTFSGASSKLLVPGAIAIPDPHALTIPQGAYYHILTGTTVGSGEKYYQPAGTNDSYGEGVDRDIGTGKVTTDGVTVVYGQAVNAPLGTLTSGPYRRVCAGVGDSITQGLNVGLHSAFIGIACIDANIGWLQLGQAIEKAQSFATVSGRHNRIKLIALCASGNANEAYGANDFNQSRTDAQVRTDRLAIWNACKTAGVARVFANTVIPLTTSSNGWVDVAGQTLHANNSERVAHNTWLRGGAPLDPLLLTPVEVGTSGAITCDVYNAAGTKVLTGTGAPHPVTAVFDTTATIESSLNSGKWAAPGGVALTGDGVHPGLPANVSMAGAIVTSLFI